MSISATTLSDEAAITLCEGIFSQLSKDYLLYYRMTGRFAEDMEEYIRYNALTHDNADYIIEKLRYYARTKQKLNSKANRTCWRKKELSL